ncbi:hypothetical protein ACJMK2_005147 [Sinanodonta woodiana]|uniref:SET domain-containing protein n=1 Tax=Sinanodonta woodiana TaxID=1069815 RepID=A0ABD3VP71_SINWO
MVTTDLEVVPGHIETPDSIELKASAVASPCIGAWSLLPIVKDTVIGPFIGDNRKGKDIKDINYRYAWEVFDPETFGLLHVIDATDPSKGNWMRYVNCAHYLVEQNLISVQQEDKVYYKAIKNIEPGEELLTWFELRKKNRGHTRKIEKEVKEEEVSARTAHPADARHNMDDNLLGKRKRIPKIFPNFYQEIWFSRQKKRENDKKSKALKINNGVTDPTEKMTSNSNSLQNCIDYIRIEDYDEHPTRQEKSASMPWYRYNIPFDITVNEASCDSRSPGECINLEIDICNQLQQVVAQQKLRNTSNKGDNKDDEQLSESDDSLNNSPRDNFENIAFGKHGNITFDLNCLERHHLKNHPSTVFNFLEVEQGNGIDLLHYSEPSNVGVLAVTNTGLESATEQDIFHCTGCGSVFKNVSRLHVHIVNCVSTANLNNSSDLNKTKKIKSSLKKNIKKQGESMNISQNFQSRLKDFARHNAVIFNMDGKQRKQIFTGCRKRKAVSLPDSPVKLTNKDYYETGYNPNNHIQRRESTELLDTHQCSGCGVKFMTILLLERQVKICAKKEKFKDLHPLKSWRSPLLEISTHASNVDICTVQNIDLPKEK